MLNITTELLKMKARAEADFGSHLATLFNAESLSMGSPIVLSDLFAEVDDCRVLARVDGREEYVNIDIEFENGEPEYVTVRAGKLTLRLHNESREMTYYHLNLRVIRHLINENQNGDVE